MYRILLADDEGIVINSLKFIIEKNFEGMFEIETAKTGRGAIEAAEHFRPDIAFMDIQMPGINGMEAMQEIRRSVPNVVFVVLSAYDKFDYAKEAINLGVMRYLNKPVNQKVVVEVIEKAIEQIDGKREKRKQDLQIKERMETVVPIIENGFISSLLFQEHFEEDINNYKNLLGITSTHGYWLGIVFGDSQQGSYMTNAVGTSVKTQINYYPKVREIIKEAFPGALVGNVSANKIPVFIASEEVQLDYDARIELIERARVAVRNMRQATGLSFRIGIGSVKKLKDSITSYDESIKALYSTQGSVAHVDDLPIAVAYEENYPVELEDGIFEKLKDGQAEECLSEADKYFDWMIGKYRDDEMSVKMKAIEFVLRAEYVMYHNGGYYRFEGRKDYLPEVFHMSHYSDLKKWFLDKLRVACQSVASGGKEHVNHTIEDAKKYISANYQRDISLDEISKQLNISPYYFSKLFKEEVGENFIEYVTAMRIGKAKEMLKDIDRSIKEVGICVGYSDPNYFSRIFKKYEGMTPTEFRDSIGK